MSYLSFLSAILILIIGVAFAGVLTAYIAKDPARRIWAGLVWTLGLGSAIVEAFGQRGADDAAFQTNLAVTSPIQVWLSRTLVFGFLYLCGVAFIDWFLRGRPTRKFGLGGTALLFTIGPVLAGMFGAKPQLPVGLLYLPLALVTIVLLPPVEPEFFRGQVKRVLAVYLYASAIAGLVAPGWATSAYSGMIPGLSFRFNGLASQANLMGPMALLYLILSWDEDLPRSKRAGPFITRLLAWVMFLLAQSKVTWVIAAVVYLVRPWTKKNTPTSATTLVRGVKALSAATLLGIIYLLRANLLDLDQQYGLATLTGRTRIWADTLQIWRQHVWFGYGPSLWSLEFRLAFGGSAYLWVGQAHNQLVQALGETGLIGLAFLIPYLVHMATVGLASSRDTRGQSTALVLFLFIRCLTETPLRTYAVNEALFAHMVIFSHLLLLERRKNAAKSQVDDLTTGRKVLGF